MFRAGISSPINLLLHKLGRLILLNHTSLELFSTGSASFCCSSQSFLFFRFFLMGEKKIWTENASNYLSHTMNSSPSCLTFSAYLCKDNVFSLAIISTRKLIVRRYLSQTISSSVPLYFKGTFLLFCTCDWHSLFPGI